MDFSSERAFLDQMQSLHASGGDLQRLIEPERRLFEDLKGNRFGDRVRLEQERIAYGELLAALRRQGF